MGKTTPPIHPLDDVEPRYLRRKGASRYASIPLRTLDYLIARQRIASHVVPITNAARATLRLIDVADLRRFIEGRPRPEPEPEPSPDEGRAAMGGGHPQRKEATL